MVKYKNIITWFVLISFLIILFVFDNKDVYEICNENQALEFINNTNNIKIKQKIFSTKRIFKIIVNEKVIAEMKSNYFQTSGSKRILYSTNGEIIAYGDRNSFLVENMKIYNQKEILLGELKTNLFKLGYTINISDENNNKIGISKKTLLRNIIINNNKNKEAYFIKGKNIFYNASEILINDKSEINPILAIYTTCITYSQKSNGHKSKK